MDKKRFGLSICFVFSFLFLFFLQFSTPEVVSNDSLYHAQVSQLGRGLLSSHFDWAHFSLFAEHFADKEFLFHVLLAPFVWLGGLLGLKLATVVFDTLAFMAFYWLCDKRRVPIPALWVVLLFASADLFLYRISITRPHILSLFITLLLCQALLENRKWWVSGLCALFVLTYTAYHLAIGFAIVYCFHSFLYQKKWNSTLLSFALFGTFLGILIHPHFPNNLLIWKVQNYDVLRLVWSEIDLGFGNEFQPPDARWFVVNFTVAFLSLPLSFFWLAYKKAEMKEDTSFFVILAFGFFCLTLMSRRFAEYWPAYALLASACLVRDASVPLDWRYLFSRPEKIEDRAAFRWGIRVTLAFTLVSALFFVRTYSKGMHLNSLEHESYLKSAAYWIKDHVPDGEIVFHSDWDEFPDLFYYNPENRYLVGLDPIFMYAYDPELWLKWRKIVMGQSPTPDQDIKKYFQSRYALMSQEFTFAILQFQMNPNMSVAYQDAHCVIFEIHDSPVISDSTAPKVSSS